MKLLFTSTGKTLDSEMDPRFGRGKGFILYDTDTKTFSWHDNTKNLEAGHGAGTNAAKVVVDLNTDAVFTSHVGPKAGAVLSAVGIDTYSHVENMTVQEAIDKFLNNELEKD